MPLVDELRQMSQDYASTLSRQSPAQAWENGEFGRWMTVQLAGNSLPAAQFLASMMVPGAQASLSAPMAASAAGSAYAEGDSAAAAALKGGLAFATEKLPLSAGNTIEDMVLRIPPPVRAQVLADAGKRLLATGSEITEKGLAGAIRESTNTIGGNAVDIYVSGKDKGLLDDVDRSALVGASSSAVPGGPKGPRVQAAPHRREPSTPGVNPQQSPSDAHNAIPDNSAGTAERGSGFADDLLRSLVQGPPVTPVVPQAMDSVSTERGAQVLPGSHMDALETAVAPGGEVGANAHQAGAEAADTQQASQATTGSHGPGPQGTSVLDSTADAVAQAPVGAMHLSDKGTLFVEGDPWQLDKRLRDAGVDKVWMWPDSVWVAPEQAARDQEVLVQPQAGAVAEAVRQTPPPVQLKMREGGMLDVEGDTQAARQWLEGAGIPTGALMDGPGMVVVTAGSVERAKQAFAEQMPVAQSANSGEPVVLQLREEPLGVGGLAFMQAKTGTDALISEGNPTAERVEVPSTTSDPNNRQARAARQPPPVEMSMLPDGRLGVKGDAQAVRAWLAESGIETRFVTKAGDGVVVTQHSVENARWALAQFEPSQEPMSGGAARARGNVTFEKGVWPYPKELRAGQVLADHGYNVQFLVTANDQKKPGVRTADTNIEGLGFLEIYSPTTDKVDNIVRMIVQKNQQAPALFVQTDLDDAMVHSIAGRVWGNPRARRIKLIFFQRSNGTLVELNRE